MPDIFDRETRSRIMASIRSRGNKSTELRMRMLLVRAGISGWRLQIQDILGRPDFVFLEQRLALFVDGCFWHGCPSCRLAPKSNLEYWQAKIQGNIARDKKTTSQLQHEGWRVIRVWEHELKEPDTVLMTLREALLEDK